MTFTAPHDFYQNSICVVNFKVSTFFEFKPFFYTFFQQFSSAVLNISSVLLRGGQGAERP